MADIHKIKLMLNDRAQSVAEKLLPNGKLNSGEWCVGSIQGEAGKSLKVCVKGSKLGVWMDFAAGEGGDLIDLWCQVKAMSVAEALDDIKAYLGVSEPEFDKRFQKRYTVPSKVKCSKPKAKMFDYFCNERALSLKALEAYRIGEDGEHAFFPFIKGGVTHLIKRYPLRVDDKGKRRPVPTEKNCRPVCFGWQAINDNTRDVYITEGEIDAMSMWMYGFPALSVPFGGGGGHKQDWIESDFPDFERFERIFLVLDNDEEGEIAAQEISKRLGVHRCYRVKLPKKDANDCMMSGIPPEEIQRAIDSAELYQPKGINLASAFEAEVISLNRDSQLEVGCTLPFAETKGRLIFRPGEVTLWGGITGHGKTQLTSFAAIHWVSTGHPTCIASLEMKASRTLLRMCKQVSNSASLDDGKISNSLRYLAERNMVLYDHVGKTSVDELLEVFDYARARFGCTQFVIDSLMRLGLPVDDYNGQEAAMYKIVNWAVANDVHVHLVAHVKKGADDHRKGPPIGDDIKGSMEVAGNAFNILIVWRNKAREEKMDTGQYEIMADASKEPAVLLNIDKQRNGDFEGRVSLEFSPATYQYFGKQDNGLGIDFLQPHKEELEAA